MISSYEKVIHIHQSSGFFATIFYDAEQSLYNDRFGFKETPSPLLKFKKGFVERFWLIDFLINAKEP